MRVPPIIYLLMLTPLITVSAQERIAVNGSIKTEPTDKVNLNEVALSIDYLNDKKSTYQIENSFKYSHLNSVYALKYSSWQENFNQFNEIKNTFEVNRAVSNTTIISATITPSLNFQENVGISDLSILGGFEVHQTIGPNSVLNVGVVRSSFLGSPKIIPIASFEQKINGQTNLSIGFPNSAITYSNNERNNFRLTNSLNGTYYNLDKTNFNDSPQNTDRLRISQMTTTLEYERNVDHNWFVNFKGGYDFNRKFQITQKNGDIVSDFNIDNGTVFSFAIKYKH